MENHVDGTMNMLGGGSSAGRKPLKSGMKELAVFREKVNEQHRQMGKGAKHLSLEEPKKLRPPPARVSGGMGSDGGRPCYRQTKPNNSHVTFWRDGMSTVGLVDTDTALLAAWC